MDRMKAQKCVELPDAGMTVVPVKTDAFRDRSRARGRGPAPQPGRERHPPGIGDCRDRTARAAILCPAALGPEGLGSSGDDVAGTDERLRLVFGGWLAGPGRGAVAVRRFLAPYLRDNPVAVYSVVALLFLLWLAFIPGIDNLGQILVIVLLAGLAVVGVEVLRRRTAPRSKESDPVRARGRGPRGGLPGA
jgi:hypothetical protein